MSQLSILGDFKQPSPWRCHLYVSWLILASGCGSVSSGTDTGTTARIDEGGGVERARPTLGTYSFTSGFVLLELPDGSERRFHIRNDLTALRTNWPFAGDFDGDGVDSVGVMSERGTVYFGTDNSSGKLTPIWEVKPGLFPVAGDFNGDGRDGFGLADLASGRVELWQSAPTGTPARVVQASFGGFVVAGDLDGDGVDEVVFFDGAAGRMEAHNLITGEVTSLETGLSGYPVLGDFSGMGVERLGVYQFGRELAWVGVDGGVLESRQLGTQTWFQWPLMGRWSTDGPLSESPGYDWPRQRAEEAGFDVAALDLGFAQAEALGLTNALLVLRGGRLIREAYWRGYDPSMANCLKSVSKSILSALVGIAARRGLLSPSDPIAAHLSSPAAGDPRGQIKIADLMSMTSGLRWDEATDLGRMVASENWVEMVLDRDLVAEPGVRFNYSTGNTHLASKVLTEAVEERTALFAQSELFEPLGIEVYRWDRDPRGLDMGGAEVWMRPRDVARFGQLYLDGGVLDGQRILDASWIERSWSDQSGGYGWWWWQWVLDGREAWAAIGYGGQLIVAVPSMKLLVVATSEWSVDGTTSLHQINALYRILNEAIVPSAP